MHGGLSPSIDILDHVRILDRVQEVPHEGEKEVVKEVVKEVEIEVVSDTTVMREVKYGRNCDDSDEVDDENRRCDTRGSERCSEM